MTYEQKRDAAALEYSAYEPNVSTLSAFKSGYDAGYAEGRAELAELKATSVPGRVLIERDEARAEVERLECELAEAKGRIADFTDGRVHTCHDECQRIECVQFRKIAALEAENARLKKLANEGRGMVGVLEERDRFKAALEKIALGDGHYGAQAKEYKEIARKALGGEG